MSKFRKIPVEISADRILESVVVHTLEGDMRANAGDWMIRGVKGEYYPCRDDIFRLTYEPVDEEARRTMDIIVTEEHMPTIPFPGVS